MENTTLGVKNQTWVNIGTVAVGGMLALKADRITSAATDAIILFGSRLFGKGQNKEKKSA